MKKIAKQLKSQKMELVVLGVFAFQLIFPQYSPVLAAEVDSGSILLPNFILKSAEISEKSTNNLAEEESQTFTFSPPSREYKVINTYTIPITAYSSTPDQTDNTPCITANGFNLCEHNQEDVIAANFLPFGTKVRIPEYFGDQIFTVQDRMNSRYYYRADIWMQDRAPAIKWGIKYTKIEVVE